MKALIINGSPRPQGVIAQALDTAADELRQAGADVDRIDVYREEFHACVGCMQCRTTAICSLPRDAAHTAGERIATADLLIVGTPTYWGGMSARLKMLFERLVPLFMGESALGIPQPRQKGKRALVIAACTTPWPFNLWMRQSRGAVQSLYEIFHTGGMKTHAIQLAGTRKEPGKLPDKKRGQIILRMKKEIKIIDKHQ